MLIPSESFQALDDAVNRLAAESILAQSGRDDGLIPSYSLLGEICEYCSLEPMLSTPLKAVYATLDKQLEAAQPFDDASLAHLRQLIDWLPAAIVAVQTGKEVASFGPAATATSASAGPSTAPAVATRQSRPPSR